MTINLKSLINRLNETCRTSLEAAAGLCLSRTNYDVEPEHFLLKIIETPDSDVTRILHHYEIDLGRLNKDIVRSLDRLRTGNTRTPAFSPRLPRLIQEAWILASIDFGATKIRSGHLILSLLANDDLARLARDISREFTNISLETLNKNFAEITAGSLEDKEATKFSDHIDAWSEK